MATVFKRPVLIGRVRRYTHPLMGMFMKRWIFGLVGVLALIAVVVGAIQLRSPARARRPTVSMVVDQEKVVEYENRPLHFVGSSEQLQRTQIVPTLETRIEDGKNVIWSCSLLAAWKELEEHLRQGPLSVGNHKELSQAIDPRDYVAESDLYSAAGQVSKGIQNRIISDMAQRFPAEKQPEFPDLPPDAVIAYAYMRVGFVYSTEYMQNTGVFRFAGAPGVDVASFGLGHAHDYAYYKLREQMAILYANATKGEIIDEFIVDMDCQSNPYQLILARIPHASTLKETIESVDRKSNRGEQNGIGPNDRLLVPEMSWEIVHRFSELERQLNSSKGILSQPVGSFQTKSRFQLNRHGVSVAAENHIIVLPEPVYYHFNRPFLIYLKKRGTQDAIFAMWVENDELLTPREKAPEKPKEIEMQLPTDDDAS